MKHGSAELLKWEQLTTGVPAALYETALSKQIGNKIAQMQGLEIGVLAPSTLHLYYDLYGFLRNQKITLFVDEKVYPVSKYGIERLMGARIPVNLFKHLSAEDLAENIRKKLQRNTIPIVISDGWCPPCGKAAPLQEYADLVSPLNGKVIIDDTQAFGVFGTRKYGVSYGSYGGGILKWLNVKSPCVVTIISLAKGFGVPMAIISGKKAFITDFIKKSETRVSSSPVSMAHISAGMNALRLNHSFGEERRNRLLNNVLYVKAELHRLGLKLTRGHFPVQCIQNLNSGITRQLHQKLQQHGVETVLVSNHNNAVPTLCIIIRCAHKPNDLKMLIASIQKSCSFLPKQLPA